MYRACELKDQTYKKTRTLHFSDKRSRNAGANENLSCGFPSIPGIAPGVAPRIVVFVLLKSRDVRCFQRTTARKTLATSHGVGSWRGVDQELANF